MTTDMSERERMRKFVAISHRRDEYMKNARTWRCPVFMTKRECDKQRAHWVDQAREANRQAVRLWWRR